MLKKLLIFLLSLAIVLALVYTFGPRERVQDLLGEYPTVPTRMGELEELIRSKEDTVQGLKPGNEAKIIWADEQNKSKTPYSIVYIHGFGASEREGSPVNRRLGEYFAANVYLVRLPEHGINRPDAFRHLSAQMLVDEVREAYMIGKSLGDSVIVVGTSMGGALSLVLASERPDMKALVLYSPAIREGGDALEQFFKPWSKYLAENFLYDNGVRLTPREGDKARFWSEQYHVNSFSSLAVLLRSKMTEDTFKNVSQPTFLGYYYKNDEEQDFVVSVPKMQEMYNSISTPERLKRKVAFPETGDHVIASDITSKDWESVLQETIDFLENVARVKKNSKSESQNELREAA
ncbi:alpha/beta hydrolase [Arthrospiribacter ruber]|uniref:Alpha/beta fold hydrolase n=1 Tax=Arthrospiribacter ruber TaxID=2487934 RepID=A0A951IYK7_9BACT|nr:alpha/beta fold hydrolase [Arthrospiribacter ruber]MBW3468226.1 alpha/beta fold hydrolase [Arthrospiribacter ruber]